MSSEPPFSARSSGRCSDTARDREDPALGTAPMTARWLLIEHPGPWRPDALTGAGLTAPVLQELREAAAGAGGRILLIRRPGRALGGDGRSRSWAVSVGGRGTVWGRWRHPADLRAAAAALRQPRPAGGDRSPLLLICTHGVHDTCCAVRGRPVAAALTERWPEAAWECSHVGGDRFAPNVVVLPDGVYYGNLDPSEVVPIVEAHLAGQVSARYLRGIARHPPVGQVAVGAAHVRWGPFGADDVEVTRIERLGADRWDIDLLIRGRSAARMTVATSARPRARLTCRAAQETSAVDFSVTAVTDLGGVS